MKNKLLNLIGTLPVENGFRQRMRFHQGWWRAFVLGEDEGRHPIKEEQKVCNTISNGESNSKNFLSSKIIDAVRQTIQERKLATSGIFEQNRLFNNLLSSQPLCFNFFGELKTDTHLALSVLKQFWPEFTRVTRVLFEYAPDEKYTNDNSAFDVAFEVMAGNRTGLVGLECKYTDAFSSKEYDKPEYRKIYEQKKDVFTAEYEKFTASKFNQLFRNQLIAEALKLNGHYDFTVTGLFCHNDDKALETGKEFQQMLNNGHIAFRIITYQEFIEMVQRLELSWEQRELSMLLWARYCGQKLSQYVFESVSAQRIT